MIGYILGMLFGVRALIAGLAVLGIGMFILLIVGIYQIFGGGSR